MKKIALLSALIFFTGFLAAPVYAETWKEYTDNTYQIKISYPPDWTQNEGMPTYNVVYFESPTSDFRGALQPFVGIKAKELPNIPINLQQLVRGTVKELKRTRDAKVKIFESQPQLFAGIPAQRIIYTRKYPEGAERKYKQIFFIKDKMLYVVTYGAAPGNYESNLEIVDKIINSFVFI